jgi:hypothetical protein
MVDEDFQSSFPDSACTIYPASRSLLSEAAEIDKILTPYLEGWQSHGAPMQAGWTLVEDRFLVIAYKESQVGGCSMDGLRNCIRNLEESLGTSFLRNDRIFYRTAGDDVEEVDRERFLDLCREGVIHEDTIVFDPTVMQMEELTEGGFARPLKTSWHAKLRQKALARK